jgi:hypothetical protein
MWVLTSNQTYLIVRRASQHLFEGMRCAVQNNSMDDEQPLFKVTDRRLFNADGSPRDLPDEPEAPQLEQTTATDVSSAPVISEAETPSPVSVPQAAQAETLDEPVEEDFGDEEIEGAQDPASFVNFLMSIASNAASALGMMEHPVTHQREVDLELGKHWIDVIGMLQKKTSGNLSPQERQMLEGFLSDLRMQYVSLANAPQKPRAFSGRDITGGK